MTKFYELKAGDQAQHGDELITFDKIDGYYAHWTNEQGELRIGNALEYELRDGIYYPLNHKEKTI